MDLGTYVSVSPEVLKELDLAQSALSENLFAKDIGDLFNGDALIRLVIHSSTVVMKELDGGTVLG
jgi:hypothetical protein